MSRRPYSTRSVILRPPLDDPDLVGAWTSECHGNRLVDLTPGGHNGTPTPSSSTVKSILGSAQLFTGASYIDCGDLSTDIRTLEFWIRPTAANDFIFDIKAGTHYVYLTAGAIDPWGWTDPNTYIDGQAAVTPVLGKWNHVVITDTTAIDADNFNFGVATANYFNGEITGVRVYSTAKSAAWVAARYREGASAIQFRTDWGVKESMVDEDAGYVGFQSSPFEIRSGEWRMMSEVVEGQLTKYMTTRPAEVNSRVAMPVSRMFATPTEAGFGTWDFWTNKAAGDTMEVVFAATDASATGGYSLYHAADDSLVIREIGVGDIVTGGTATSGVWHRHTVPRRFSGLFSPYCDRVAWGVPAADLTITAPTHVVVQCNVGGGSKFGWSDKVGGHGFVKYLGEVAP